MKSQDIRNSFLNYFLKQGHEVVSSSRLIPDNDPTLLFTNAGMNQFKNIFLGHEKRPYNRAATSQKCVRAGGKHNDLENVGFTARHHTFFEMLGNFSFGDYFKKDAIHFAWDFITKEMGLEKDRLYVSVFQDDDEAADIWHKQEGIPKERIYRFGEKDNFWRMGDTGPCGPCSEIFYDLGDSIPGDPKDNVMGGDGDRFMEIWNLVFMQFFESPDGKMTPLPKPSIDTGMGLERLAVVKQKEINNYHTDLFFGLIERAMTISGKEYIKNLAHISNSNERHQQEMQNVAFRVMADHARSTAFLMADGVLPSNEGRGYVLRRILRRAIRYGRNLTDKSLLPEIVSSVIDNMGAFYPELVEQKNLILATAKDEEKRFLTTLDQGTQILLDEIKNLKNKGLQTLPGQTVFKLYDTFGFPTDLTELMAKEHELKIDSEGFEKHMNQAREKAKASWKGNSVSTDAGHILSLSQKAKSMLKSNEIAFLGYQQTQNQSPIGILSDGQNEVNQLTEGQQGLLFVPQTSFYAESGGQVGDQGTIQTPNGTAEVFDCIKNQDIHWHHIKVVDGKIKINELAQLTVTTSKRRQTACNHSATHLLHSALRKVLGEHVTQAGSLVESDRLRFDFTHNQPVSSSEIEKIEILVNQQISMSNEVQTDVMSPEAAKQKGAMALFGEKYGDLVRVINMGPFSMELCGGIHVKNTAEIRLFKVVIETGVSAGVRRIEAITGDAAFSLLSHSHQYMQESRMKIGSLPSWDQQLNENLNPIAEWIDNSKNEIKDLQKQIQKLKGTQIDVEQLIHQAKVIHIGDQQAKLVLADIPVDDRAVLSDLSDKLRDKVGTGIVVIVGQGEKSHPLIVTVSKNLIKSNPAGQILKSVAEMMGGKGGGRPDFAQGAVPDRSQLNAAFKMLEENFTN